mmetsp:Transcript_25233/g.67481  ORF Transcript_25233/g.67481 Transcript_25233/m.67481 type:complete len:212 (+) Transcript_25233:307-942(+)
MILGITGLDQEDADVARADRARAHPVEALQRLQARRQRPGQLRRAPEPLRHRGRVCARARVHDSLHEARVRQRQRQRDVVLRGALSRLRGDGLLQPCLEGRQQLRVCAQGAQVEVVEREGQPHRAGPRCWRDGPLDALQPGLGPGEGCGELLGVLLEGPVVQPALGQLVHDPGLLLHMRLADLLGARAKSLHVLLVAPLQLRRALVQHLIL